MEHRVRVFESAAATELAKRHMRASCLSWHGDKMTWFTRFQWSGSPDVAKQAAFDYLVALYRAEDIEFWRNPEGESDVFFATFKMGKDISLEGYRIE